MARVHVDLYREEIRQLVVSDDTKNMVHDIADPVEHLAQVLAPKDTGRGARSIHTEMVLDGDDWEARISWTWPETYYLYWHEQGSRELVPRPFLEPALRAAV